jgi:hypothetical protein
MPQITEPNRLDSQRENLRGSLDEIANDIAMALRDAGLMFPVYIAVTSSGDALATIATPLDPTDQEWQQAAAIVNGIIEKSIGCGKLRARELTCAVANAAPMTAADVTAE